MESDLFKNNCNIKKHTLIKIGLDPAFRQNGFAICIINEQKEVRFITFKRFINFINFVLYEAPDNAKCAIENSNLQNCVFNKRAGLTGARQVGKNQAASQIAYDLFVSRYGKKNVLNISPKGKGSKQRLDSVVFRIMQSQGLKFQRKKLSNDEKDSFMMTLFI